MCTLTVFHDHERLLVTMNRDEARFRGPEQAPQLHPAGVPGGPVWLGPIDTDSGGTWIGVNDRGCVACLLNRYAPEDSDSARLLPGLRSRGEIIPTVLAHPTATGALDFIRERLDPLEYGSFTLAFISTEGSHAFEWAHQRGLAESACNRPWDMLTSSALDTAEVLAWRRKRFGTWLDDGASFEGSLPAFHLDCPAGKEAWAPLMERPISATRSITQVELDHGMQRATMRYWPRQEGQTAFGAAAVTLELPLKPG